MRIGERIARFLAPQVFEALEKQKQELEFVVNNRVADALFKMDPFEPLMKKYNVVFSEEWERPEERLDEISQIRMYTWAYGVETDPSFRHIMNWFRNTQGNATLQKGKHHDEWLYGRAAVSTITLLVREVGRLASRYRDIMTEKGHEFDEHLPVE